MTHPHPPDPIAATTHPDPYSYYAELMAKRPLYYDETLKMWVASSAEMVTAVLTHPACRVRPVSEPVPTALFGSASGEVFQHLIRMTDGDNHDSMKHSVSAAFHKQLESHIHAVSERWAAHLFKAFSTDPDGLMTFAFHLPVYVIAALLGVPDDQLAQTAQHVGAFVRGLTPNSSADDRQRGNDAAHALRSLFASMPHDVLMPQAAQHREIVIANTIGLLMQSYDATAGLICNTLRTMALHPLIQSLVSANPTMMRGVIQEVLRWESPIQNTRRFVAEDLVIGSQSIHAGDTILVVLAAANRDAAVNPHPQQFDPCRTRRQLFTFGVGSHACPAEMMASTITQAAIEAIISAGVSLDQWAGEVSYRPSVNARIPTLKFPVQPVLNTSHFYF